MNQIPLSPIPNQGITLALDGNVWEITVAQDFSGTYIFAIVNGEIIANGLRAANLELLPGFKDKQKYGALVFVCSDNSDSANYLKFDNDHLLYYVPNGEIEEWLAQTRPE